MAEENKNALEERAAAQELDAGKGERHRPPKPEKQRKWNGAMQQMIKMNQCGKERLL